MWVPIVTMPTLFIINRDSHLYQAGIGGGVGVPWGGGGNRLALYRKKSRVKVAADGR